jgi:hypothetical protein
MEETTFISTSSMPPPRGRPQTEERSITSD